jgi:hypothetical protein
MNEEVSWSKLFEYREQIHRCYREVWDIKILRKRFPLLLKILHEGEKVWTWERPTGISWID